VITFEQDSLVACRIWDFSSAGVGLFATTAVELPPEFDLTFDYATAIALPYGESSIE
jgi:hypothetical protein